MDQENAITRGVQVNQTLGKFTASFSWNDGYYSNRYSGLSGSLTYANGPHSVSFVGMGYLGTTNWLSLVTPIQNNSTMYAALYLHKRAVDSSALLSVQQCAGKSQSEWYMGRLLAAVHLASPTLKRGFSLTGRWRVLGSTGSNAEQSVNLLYGPGSAAWSLTVTPTFQYKHFFTRGDVSFVLSTTRWAALSVPWAQNRGRLAG